MEYCEGNDLDLYLKQQNKNQISETEAKTVIMQIVQGMSFFIDLYSELLFQMSIDLNRSHLNNFTKLKKL